MPNDNSKLILIRLGYTCAFLPILLLPVIFTPLAIIIGFINITNDEDIHGVLQIIIGVALGIVGSVYFAGPGLGLPKLHI